MARQRSADRRPIAVDHIEDTRRHLGCVHDLGEDPRIEWRQLRRLQHHRAPRRQRRAHLGGNRRDRPVPRRDQRRHANRLADDLGAAKLPREIRFLQRGQRGLQHLQAQRRLLDLAQPLRRADLVVDGQRDVVHARLVQRDQPRQHVHAGFAGGGRPGREGRPGRRHGGIDIGRAAHGHAANHCLGGRIDDVEAAGARGWRHPLAADIELVELIHALCLPEGWTSGI
ncbi:hypothetical protein D3C72_1436200 [compost metagenome]